MPIATKKLRPVGCVGGGGSGGTGDVPIATKLLRPVGCVGGGGSGGTGEVPIATNVGRSPKAVPVHIRWTETAVTTTKSASAKVRTKFFILDSPD